MLTRTSSFLFITILLTFFGSACKTVQFPLQKEEEKPKPKLVVKPPDWVLNKEHPSFPQGRFLVGVGFSDRTSTSADESARSNLAKTLNVRIRSTMKDVSTTEKIHVESVIETEVDTVLRGVEIKEGWLDQSKGVYYSLAVVERNKAASSIQARISEIESALQMNLNDGIEAENRADVIAALSHYQLGYLRALDLPPLKNARHIIISSKENSGPHHIRAGEFESRIRGIVHNLNLATVSGDRQIVKTRKGVAEPLVAKVYLLKDGNRIPVPNIPVLFSYKIGHGELEREKNSGSDGTVRTKVHEIFSNEEANHVIVVKLDYSRIRSNFDEDFVEKLLSPLNNKRAIFNYAVQTLRWTSTKSQAWQKSITDLGNQLIANVPPGRPLLGVMPFKDIRSDRTTPFSRILNEDIKTILARSGDLKIREIKINEDQQPEEIANANGLQYYVIGSYRMEKGGLEVRGRMIETSTKNIQATGDILIKKDEINPKDRELLMGSQGHPLFPNAPEGYDQSIENLFSAKPEQASFELSVWTKKRDYEIGEQISFFVKADADCYLTLLDISPDGKVTVMFPNKFHKDNLIRANVTNKIPEKKDGFSLQVREPSGLDRIKAFATLSPGSPLKLDLSKGFHTIRPGTMRGTRGIQVLSKKFTPNSPSKWSEAHAEIFIHKKGKVFIRGKKKLLYAD
jgi:TolB-like protein